MRTSGSILLLATMVVLLPAVAGPAPGDGIMGTAHDFSAKTGGNPCTFCHTPHNGHATTLLWNRALPTHTFSWDNRSTAAGTIYPVIKGDTYKGPTARCLGCHDGTVAPGNIVRLTEGTSGSPLDTSNAGFSSGFKMGATGSGPGNMSGNHPVAMPYPFGGKSTYNGVTTGDQIALSAWQADPQSLNIRLYNDDGSGFITAGARGLRTGVECSSCHDPHNKASVDEKFLRGRRGGTGTDNICMKCHRM